MKLLEKIFGNYSEKEVRRIIPLVDRIDSLEREMEALSDSELKGMTTLFKERYRDGETLDDLLPEAFAVVREASRRVLGMRHFRVQLIGGIVLHQGRIAEMKTGEGKTLVATLPVYLNALTGNGVHIVTVNDYLAKRDSEWMGKIYTFLGLTVGLIIHDLDNDERRNAYACDITYGTNNEFGFDYLRDNMVIYKNEMVQRELNYAIVDEVDSILIDEARTPLIISGTGDKSTEMYARANSFASRLRKKVFTQMDDKESFDDLAEDYIVDEKANTTALTANGIRKAEQYFVIENLSDPENMTIQHHINQAVRAHGIMKRDKDYVVKDGEVIIVDEFTGRLMYGRRYSDGLHQAIEAKEKVNVERESKTLATITFQNYFRLYKKLAGMTGTAQTEEVEFNTIYKLDVIEIPTNMPMIRIDHPDCVYKTKRGKFNAVINEILDCNRRGQPVLVGTISIETSEELSAMLKRRGITNHQVLNAKYHEREAEIVAQAGKYKAVTIATNMAGRGTDIVLGGNPEFLAKQEMKKMGYSDDLILKSNSYEETTDDEVIAARKMFRDLYEKYKTITSDERNKVIEAGGLHILGTERHESRRIDNQLRGRSGRQGDPGSSRFYISLEDDLMRMFGNDRLTRVVDMLGLEEDQAIEHNMLSKALENAQKRVEGRNFDIRKHVLQYDDVMNKQRDVIYKQRRMVLDGENLRDSMLMMVEKIIDSMLNLYTSETPHPEMWDWESMKSYYNSIFTSSDFNIRPANLEGLSQESLKERLIEHATKMYEKKEAENTPDIMRELERVILLRVCDQKWMDHIDNMDQLRVGIGLRAYGQRDPVVEYKFEGYEMFEEMIMSMQEDVIKIIMNSKVNTGNTETSLKREQVAKPITATHGDEGATAKKPVIKSIYIGRNDPCPCGSGKKYKLCCGRKT